jgi:hypothetical protein
VIVFSLLALLSPAALAGGSVEVRGSVPGGRITVDGADTGLTAPAVVEDVQPGLRTVGIIANCRRGEAKVEVVDGVSARADVMLHQTGGTLVVRLDPAIANVRMDGAAYPSKPGDPVPVGCGEHALGATLEGYMPMFVNFTVREGELVDLPVKLQAIGRGRLRVSLVPASARLVLDGVEIGRGTQEVPDVPAGPHLVQAELAGYESYKQNMIVNKDREHVLDIDLQPLPSTVASVKDPRRNRKAAGVVLSSGGGLALMTSGALLLAASTRYQDYLERADAINTGESSESALKAQAYRDEEVAPMALGGAVAGGLGVVLGGVGITLMVGN